MLAGGQFDKILNLLRATTAAAGFFQTKLGFDLAGHHNSGTARVTNIGFCDSLTEAKIHGDLFPVTIMRSILSMPHWSYPVKRV